MKRCFVHITGWWYRHVGAPIFYLWDSEPIHDFFLDLGEVMARIPGVPALIALICRVRDPRLITTVAGIRFENPIGLAAGFDHEAQLPGMIHAIGFGFESVGTITNGSYGGNEYPRIKRLVRSRSILVNKGLKSSGIRIIATRLASHHIGWRVPIGISIGPTNSPALNDLGDVIRDIVSAFTFVRDFSLPFAYYELNISCPNLNKEIALHTDESFGAVLTALDSLSLAKPLFIKMPINLSNDAMIRLADISLHHSVAALILGNLQHDRTLPVYDVKEIKQFEGKRGNFSGIPCQARSDELIKILYPKVKGKIALVGCGGVFSAEDAYRKIRNGASLIQLASATIFEGPQVAGEICADLPILLQRDSVRSIADAVGLDATI